MRRVPDSATKGALRSARKGSPKDPRPFLLTKTSGGQRPKASAKTRQSLVVKKKRGTTGVRVVASKGAVSVTELVECWRAHQKGASS